MDLGSWLAGTCLPVWALPDAWNARLYQSREHAEGNPGVRCWEQHHKAPSCCVELEKAKQEVLRISQQLSSEVVKCRQMEEKNMALQLHLEGLLGHNYVLVEKQTMNAIQESFSDFQKFIQKLHNIGLGEVLDANVLDLLENLETDHKQHLPFLVRKLCRTPSVCNKTNHMDLQEVFRSSRML